MNKHIIALGILLLLLFSIVTPMTLGLDTETTVEDEYLQNLAFYCYDGYGSAKQDYYKQYLQREDTTEVTVELDRVSLPVELPSDTSSGGPMDAPWPMQSHNTRHTGRSQFSTAQIDGFEKWRFKVDGSVDGGPVIDNTGIIYFGGNYEGVPWYLIAIYPNGTLKWRYKTGGLIWSTPVIAEDGTIYIGSWDGYLYAINPDGTRKWRFLANDNIASSPAIAEDGTIYFGAMGPGSIGRVFAINPDGSEKWHYDTDSWISSDPAIDLNGIIYIGSSDTYLYALNINGTLKWRFKTGDYVKGPPSISDDGTIYIGSWDDYLYALFPNNGTMKWRCKVGYGTETTPAIASDGTIYVGGDKLWAIYPNGTKRWTFNMGAERHIHMSCPAISSDGTIYFGTNIGDGEGGEIIAVNPDGTEKWRKMIANDWVDSSPCISENGTLYIGSTFDSTWESGYLHAFGPIESNEPPKIPSISGKTNGKPGVEYTYTFIPIDPDNNPVRLYIDWGDGNIIDWSKEYASGEPISRKHTFTEEGNYTIRAKAKDNSDAEGPWGYFEITIPRTRTTSYHWFLERFPILERLLMFLLL